MSLGDATTGGGQTEMTLSCTCLHERTRRDHPGASVGSLFGNVVVPAAIVGAGEHATRRFLEFFAATIRNRLFSV
jgi:hypothetical protein